MKPRSLTFFIALSVLIAEHVAAAQGFGGCVDSPENPTVILAGLAAGGYVLNQLRRKAYARRTPLGHDARKPESL